MKETTSYPQAPMSAQAGALTATLLPRAAYDVAYTPDAMVAGFAFDMQAGLHAFASDRQTPFLTRPFSLAFTPKGCDVRSRSQTGGEYLTVRLAPGEESGLMAQVPRQYSNAAHPEAGLWARQLRRLLMAAPDNLTEIEELAHLLFGAALQDPEPATGNRSASSITQARLRRLNDLIEAHFHEAIGIADMAAALGLSTAFFIRAFKAATGATPHAYLTERRLAEAHRLMALPGGTLADIANQCGFSSQAHMTHLFGRSYGISPARYRALLLS